MQALDGGALGELNVGGAGHGGFGAGSWRCGLHSSESGRVDRGEGWLTPRERLAGFRCIERRGPFESVWRGEFKLRIREGCRLRTLERRIVVIDVVHLEARSSSTLIRANRSKLKNTLRRGRIPVDDFRGKRGRQGVPVGKRRGGTVVIYRHHDLARIGKRFAHAVDTVFCVRLRAA